MINLTIGINGHSPNRGNPIISWYFYQTSAAAPSTSPFGCEGVIQIVRKGSTFDAASIRLLVLLLLESYFVCINVD